MPQLGAIYKLMKTKIFGKRCNIHITSRVSASYEYMFWNIAKYFLWGYQINKYSNSHDMLTN